MTPKEWKKAKRKIFKQEKIEQDKELTPEQIKTAIQKIAKILGIDEREISYIPDPLSNGKYFSINNKTINKEIVFTELLEYPLKFENCIFKEKVNFSGATFKEKIDFSGATFEKEVNFKERCEFKAEAIFSFSKFKNGASFSNSKFLSGAYFNEVTFYERTDFHECEFEKVACFYGITFNEAPNFSQAIFKGSLNLVNAKLNFSFDELQEKIKQEYKYFNKDKEEKEKSL